MILNHVEFYLAPQDDIKTPLLNLIKSAQKSIDIEIYGYTLAEMTDALIERNQSGAKIRILYDYTQAFGPKEKEQLGRVYQAKIEFYVGTSSKRKIRHSKFMIVDGITVEDGSLNYSDVAFEQNNTVRISTNRELAALLISDWESNKAWILANESGYQDKILHDLSA